MESNQKSSPNHGELKDADVLPPPPPPLCPLPEVSTQLLLPPKHSANLNSKNAARKLVTDHLEHVLRESQKNELNDRECEILQCHKTVRRLVSSLDLTSVDPCVVNDKLDSKSIDENETEIVEPVVLSFYRYVSPCIQKGPSCGVAALCMALNLIGHSCHFDVALRVAQEMNFTKQGEMFSAENLLSLACRLAPCEGRLLRKEDGIRVKGQQIIEELLTNHVVLIPYDRDGNSEPCLKSGHKAHWACLTGVALLDNQKVKRQLDDDQTVSIVEDSELLYLHHVNITANTFRSDILWSQRTSFVYAMHGRSTHARLWRLDDVLRSNAQLTGLDPYIREDLPAFIVPDSGVEGGLCGQVIVLSSFKKNIA